VGLTARRPVMFRLPGAPASIPSGPEEQTHRANVDMRHF
jgi:hypothetical protein